MRARVLFLGTLKKEIVKINIFFSALKWREQVIAASLRLRKTNTGMSIKEKGTFVEKHFAFNFVIHNIYTLKRWARIGDLAARIRGSINCFSFKRTYCHETLKVCVFSYIFIQRVIN